MPGDLPNSKIEPKNDGDRASEIHLIDQLKLVESADLRASIVGGFFTAAGIATIAAMVTFVSRPESLPIAIVIGSISMAALFLIAASLCVLPLHHIDTDLPIAEHGSEYTSGNSGEDIIMKLAELAESYQCKIAVKREAMRSSERQFRWALYAGVLAPVVGAITWVATKFAI